MPGVAPRRLALSVGVATLALLAVAAAGRAAPPAGASSPALWLFFSPSTDDVEKDVKALAGLLKERPDVRFRPCLLAPDLGAIASPTSAFASTVAAIRSLPVEGSEAGLPVLDADGLAAARRFGIESVPAWVYVAPSGRSHVASGRGANLKGLLSCK